MIKTAAQFLELYESGKDFYTLARVDLSEDVWMELLQLDDNVRETVACNKILPFAVMEKLALDPNEDVRMSLAIHRRLSPLTYQVLSQDPSKRVRGTLAMGLKVPLEVLQKMLEDPDPDIRKTVEENLEERQTKVGCPRISGPDETLESDVL